jgi:GNAT superfamily N-acetyltransferase
VSGLEVVPYDPARREDVFALLASGGHEADGPLFDWWFDGNPVGPRTIFLSVAEDGRLAGILAASFYRSIVGGREALAALPLWAVTHSDFRGRGIFQSLNGAIEAAAREAGAVVELGFTNRLAGPIYIAKLGWRDVNRLRIWARLRKPIRAIRAARAGAALELPTATTGRFGAEHGTAYRALAPALPSHFVRDAAYLNWRYADAPRPYRLFTSGDGYAVAGVARKKGLLTAYVADLVAPADSFRETRWLLRRCIGAFDEAHAVLALAPSTAAQKRAFVSAGFVPTRETIRLIGTPLEGTLPGAWHFTLGDTDYF